MSSPSRFLLAVLLLTAQPLCAQSPASPAGTEAPTTAIKTWFIRLIPPRTTFAQDITEAEQELMQEHYLYWKGLFEKGVCVFGGPVPDPRGVYGVLAVRAVSEDEARRLAAADPSVKGDVNKFEVAEMRIAFLPKANAD